MSKKERLMHNDDVDRVRNLHLYELYLPPLVNILSQGKN